MAISGFYKVLGGFYNAFSLRHLSFLNLGNAKREETSGKRRDNGIISHIGDAAGGFGLLHCSQRAVCACAK